MSKHWKYPGSSPSSPLVISAVVQSPYSPLVILAVVQCPLLAVWVTMVHYVSRQYYRDKQLPSYVEQSCPGDVIIGTIQFNLSSSIDSEYWQGLL